jgi:hypothetical protein
VEETRETLREWELAKEPTFLEHSANKMELGREAALGIVRSNGLVPAKSWKPAFHPRAAVTVLRAELLTQAGLLVEDNKEVETDPKAYCVDEQSLL